MWIDSIFPNNSFMRSGIKLFRPSDAEMRG